MMLMDGLVYPMIFYAYCHLGVSTFNRQSRHDAKNLPFSAVEAAVDTCKDAICRLSVSTRTVPNSLAFESFLMLLNLSELSFDQLLLIL